jgi:hypothetical protein
MERHDKYTITVLTMLVGFDPNLDEFASKVAYELRDKTIYRSDWGKNARGLVRASDDLRQIHHLFMFAPQRPVKRSDLNKLTKDKGSLSSVYLP